GDPSSGRECSAQKTTGLKCNADSECNSGHCVDDECVSCVLDDHCSGQQVCNDNTCITLAGFGGICDSTDVCELGLVCYMGRCGECEDENDCDEDEFCGVGRNNGYACIPKKGIMSGCTSDSECDSGHCVDKMCVACVSNNNCNGQQVCKDNTCITLAEYGGKCDSSDFCKLGLVCYMGRCGECENEDDCDKGEFCGVGRNNGYTCIPKRGIMSRCLTENECTSGYCVNGVCVTCVDDSHCGELACRENTCVKLSELGDTCKEDRNCLSGLECHMGVCSSCTRDSDCDEGQYCGGDEYSNGLMCVDNSQFGSQCKVDKHCDTHLMCSDGVCGYCKSDTDCLSNAYCKGGADKGKECVSKKEFWAICEEDTECTSGICRDDGVCVFCDDTRVCDTLQYCDDGECINVKKVGQRCKDNQECESNQCAASGICGDCVMDRECGTGKFCQNNVCMATLQDFATCQNNHQCASQRCDGGTCVQCFRAADCERGQTCTFGECFDKLPAGKPCATDDQCISRICGMGLLCHECDSDFDCDRDTYCHIVDENEATDGEVNRCEKKFEIAAKCLGNNQCMTRMCDNVCGSCLSDFTCGSTKYCENTKPFDPNSCKPYVKNGEPCESSKSCESGFCDSLCGECITDKDCKKQGTICRGTGSGSVMNECHTLILNNRPCNKDSDCQSGLCIGKCVNCKTSDDCISGKACFNNVCKWKRRYGYPCSKDDQCKSVVCDFDRGICVY
ncbi:unnamed protein product, partial [Owenia fusiformis]